MGNICPLSMDVEITFKQEIFLLVLFVVLPTFYMMKRKCISPSIGKWLTKAVLLYGKLINIFFCPLYLCPSVSGCC